MARHAKFGNARACGVVLLATTLACDARDTRGGRDSSTADTGVTATPGVREPARVQGDSPSCYVGDGSVLARAPGSAAEGPAGLRGWIRFDAPLALDSGPARLVDSDGRAMDARWHRVRVDSVTIAAMNDFLRVEMRLRVDDDSASGVARATSDAAREPAPGGGTRDFQREWSLAARRASCDSMAAIAARPGA